MSRNQAPMLLAGGNVSPSRFVKLSTAANHTALQATAGSKIIGISGVGTRLPPGITGDDGYHAVDTENIDMFSLGDICLLKIGSGGCTAGDYLKSDASGQGVTAGAGEFAGAVALQTRLVGEFALVQIINSYADVSAATSVADGVPIVFGDGTDAVLLWSEADVSDPGFVLGLGDTSQMLHVTDYGARATDWAVTSPTHPTLYLHSNTTPTTDYLLIGTHDGTKALIDVVGGTQLDIKTSGTSRLFVSAGLVLLGDTTDANLTTGLVINQGASDDGILSLKSSDVTHGMTTVAETDTYCLISKGVATEGGLKIVGLSEGEEGADLYGYGGTTDTTDAPTTTSAAAFQITGGYANTTGVQAVAAAGNLFQVRNSTNATTFVNEFIVKGDGELYSNQSATVGTFDDYDDALMCADLSYALSREYDKMLGHNRELFNQIGFLADNPGGEGGMFSLTKMNMLMLCAIGQVGRQVKGMAEQLGFTLSNNGAARALPGPA